MPSSWQKIVFPTHTASSIVSVSGVHHLTALWQLVSHLRDELNDHPTTIAYLGLSLNSSNFDCIQAMDPVTAVGLASSVAQLSDMARSVVSNMWQYFQAVQDAPKRSQELRQEMCIICDILESLETTMINSRFPSTSSISIKNSIDGFQAVLNKMTARIAESQTRGLSRLKWPFTEGENKRLISAIERYKGSFSLALNIRNVYINPVIGFR
jgi:hypothetical protein